MKLKINYLILLFFSGLLMITSSCSKNNDCIIGNGIIDTEAIHEQEYKHLSIIGDFQVFVHMHDSIFDNLFIEAESNILPLLHHHQSTDRLYIQTLEDVCIQPTLPVKWDVYSPDLLSIGVFGDSYVVTDSIINEYFSIYSRGGSHIKANITSDHLTINAHGNSRIEINGTSIKSKLNIHDYVLVESYPLVQDTCYVYIIGSGVAYVNVENYLDVKIEGDGIVYYTGTPTVNSDITGSGKIIQE